LLIILPTPLFARGQYFGYAQQGGYNVLTSSLQSTTKVERSFPGATVKVCLANTGCSVSGGTVITLFADSSGTAKANPFTAGTDGSFLFFTDTVSFDIVFYGSGITTGCGLVGQLPCISAFTWPNQTFNGSGSSALTINVLDYGAKCDGLTDDTTAIQAALAVTGPHIVSWPAATCLVTDTLNITQSRVSIIGQGEQTTLLKFQPLSGGKPVFKYAAGVTQSVISGFGFTSTNVTLRKIMVDLVNTEEVELAHLASSDGTWTGNVSECIRSEGRQMLNAHDLTISTDQPVHIMKNASVAIDADHYHFWNCYFTANNAPIYLVDVDARLTNLTLDGYQSWNRGSAGFKCISNVVSASNSISINNVRWEQEQSATGYLIEFSGTNLVNSLRLINLYGGLSARGIKLRSVSYPTIENIVYVGTSVVLDVDSTVAGLEWKNFYAGTTASGVTSSITGQNQIRGDQVNTLALPVNAKYESTGSVNSLFNIFNGVNVRMFNGSLADTASTNLWADFAGTEQSVLFIVSARNTTSGAPEGGIVACTGTAGGSCTLLSGSTNFAITGGAGKLSLFWQSAFNTILVNQLGGGAGVNYNVMMVWK